MAIVSMPGRREENDMVQRNRERATASRANPSQTNQAISDIVGAGLKGFRGQPGHGPSGGQWVPPARYGH